MTIPVQQFAILNCKQPASELPGKEAAIFDRFYTERPLAEKFGTHSGLGLSISKQIIDAHDGQITAENIVTPDGEIAGASFKVRLVAA